MNMQKQPTWKLTMDDDLAHRSSEIHWPDGFSPETAEIFSHTEILVHAPCEKIWQHLLEVTKWPEWYSDAKDVRLIENDGTILKKGTTFQWTTFGLALESKVDEFVPSSRVGWFAYAPGSEPNFYHTWYVVPQEDGSCLVITEEVGKGGDATYMRQTDEGLMHRGHEMWLAALKWVSEDK